MIHRDPRVWLLGFALILVVLFAVSLGGVGSLQNLFAPVGSVTVQFESSVTYDQALRIVADLGLAPAAPCVNFDSNWSAWLGTDDGQYPEQWSEYSSELFVIPRDISAPDWLSRLRNTKGVSTLALNPSYHCPLSEAVTPVPGGRYYLTPAQTGALVRVTFSGDTSYGAALAQVLALGFQLADPCYPNPHPGPTVAWTPMGQEDTFGQTHAFLLITTRANSTQWQQQIQSASGVTGVQLSSTVSCPGH